MHGFDFNFPRYPVRTPDVTFRWSVGYYRSPRKRVVLAWFVDVDLADERFVELGVDLDLRSDVFRLNARHRVVFKL